MKNVFVIAFLSVLLFSCASLYGQLTFHEHLFEEEFISGTHLRFDDTLPLPHSNWLRNDDPAFNKRYPLIIPILEVPAINSLIWSYDKYVAKYSYANISIQTVKDNFKNGWEWDTDDFPTNFSSHPYSGGMYFNAARANGYKFLQSAPFALGGSLMWEMAMENTKPSYNDLINTTLSGIFLGEVLYRLSSSVLDDRKTGGRRVGREIIGTIIDPVRGLNRLGQGKSWRVLNREVYEKEPLSLNVAGGTHQTNDGPGFNTLTMEPMISLNFSYGDPYETRFRKPFDFFRLRTDMSFGNPSNVINNVIGVGFLFGGNGDSSLKAKTLLGGFQHYEYWNTDSFEIGTIAFGGGLLYRVPLFKKGNFENQFHLSLVPLGGSNARKVQVGDQNTGFKNYTYSGGAEMSLESALNFGWGELGGIMYLYALHTYVGKPGNNVIAILRPRLSFKLYRSLNIGYEYLWYLRNDYYPIGPDLHVRTSEQRFFLLLNFGNFNTRNGLQKSSRGG